MQSKSGTVAFVYIIAALALSLTFVSPTFAEPFGYIQGYIRDAASQPIADAQVESAADYTTISQADGYYLIALPPGDYSVRVIAYGYKLPEPVTGVSVITGVFTDLDFTLEPASLSLAAVYPTLGTMGQDLDVTLTGSGFDTDTRLSMSLDVGNIMKIIGSVDTAGGAWAIELVGTTAYIADGGSNFQAIDISDPQNPVIIGSLDFPTYARDLAVANGVAYVANTTTLELVDIDPGSPGYLTSIGSVGGFEYATGVKVDGNRAYVADGGGNNVLEIIDIDPASPTYLTRLASVSTPGHPVAVHVSDGIAYLTESYDSKTSWAGLELVDVDPSSPTYLEIIGSFYRQGCQGFTIKNKVAYIAGITDILLVVDVNPESPAYLTLIGYVYASGRSYRPEIVGDIAYLANNANGLDAIDISDPTNPRVIGWVDTPGDAMDVKIAGSLAFVADGSEGLQIIDISHPEGSSTLGNLELPELGTAVADYATCIAVQGSYAYVGSAGGLHVVDVSDPVNPVITGSTGIPETPYGLDVIGNRAYILSGHGSQLKIVDISDPYSPTVIGFVDTVDYAYDVTVHNDLAYVADWDGGLHIIDVDQASPTYLTIVGTVQTPTRALDVAVSGNRAYIGGVLDIYIADIDPTSPNYLTIIGTLTLPRTTTSLAVADNILLVTTSGGKLYLIDVSNSANPVNVSTLELGSFANHIAMSGTQVYLALQEGTVLIIDIINPAQPIVVGKVDVPGSLYELEVIDDTAYIAAFHSGLQIVPLPVEIESLEVTNDSQIQASLPSPTVAGHYLLRVFNSDQSDQLVGAVTFSDSLETLNAKAIIVAGGGPDAPGGIWAETRLCANKAYDVLIQQGYDHDSIYYLSMETGNSYVDRPALHAFLADAIQNWAADASHLLVYFVDHGVEDQFILFADQGYSQTVDVSEVDGWLDALQETMLGPVTFLYDACLAGSFLSKMRPPAGKERVVITGASYEPAYFLGGGETSFSYQFWDQVLMNEGNVGRAFQAAKTTMQGHQTALIEANWNLESPEETEDVAIAESMVVKRGSPVYISVHPFVGSVSDGQSISGTASAAVWAGGVIDAERVQVQIIPPNVKPEISGIPIADLPTIDLTYSAVEDKYTGTYDGFNVAGTYILVARAVATHEIYSYVEGAMQTQNIYSPSMYTYVTRTDGTASSKADDYEEDDTFEQAGVIAINAQDPQPHNFHDIGDADWVRFYGIAGESYRIKAGNPSTVCDAVIEIYDTNGTTRLGDPQNEAGSGQEESLDWQCPADGVYYVKLSNLKATFGENVKYDLSVYQPVGTGDETGMLIGKILDGVDNPINGALIRSNVGNCTAISLPNGAYFMMLPVAPDYAINVSVDHLGLAIDPVTKPNVAIAAAFPTVLDIIMGAGLKGDINGDGLTDLTDAVIALRLLSGFDTISVRSDYFTSGADVSSDGRIGVDESIFILQQLSTLRTE